MLVLSRKKGQEVVIDQDIHVEVLEVRGKNVKIGIRAPRERRILRGEIVPQQEESQQCATVG